MTNALLQILTHRVLLGSVLAATGLAATAHARSSEDPAKLLAAHRAGLGEAKAIAGLGTLRSKGKLVFEGFAGEGAFTEVLAPDGAARMEVLFPGAPPSVTCSNGKLFWMTGPGGVEIKQGWAAAADCRGAAIGRHRDWRDVYAGAELVGESKAAGRDCYELKMLPKSPADLGIEAVPGEESPAPDTWWLDRATKELVQTVVYGTVSGAGWQRLVSVYSDWRTVNGVRFPFETRLTFGPADNALTVRCVLEKLETGVSVPSSTFQPDEPVFRELAKLRAGETRKDPGFALQQRKPAATATVRVPCKPEEIAKTLAVLLPEVAAYLSRERLTPAGPPFARYFATSGAFEIEAGIPVAQAITGNARVKPSALPGGDVVAGMHVGPYEELPKTHEELGRWLDERGLQEEGAPWQVYWTDPGLQRDPSKWRTEIFQPVTAESAAKVRAASSADTGATRRQSGEGPAAGPERDPRLVRLGTLAVGTWKVDGGTDGPNGTLVFEWLEGGHFLVQKVDLLHGDHVIKGVEIIGRERPMGVETPSTELKSRFYDNLGNTLDYVWEFEDRSLTIWGGQKGSPASFRGTFSADGNTLTGGWKWPGGGFDLVGKRVTPAPGAKE